MTATFPVSVTAKTRTITNGTANDGSVVEAEMVELYNNDIALAAGINDVGGSDSVAGFIDGKILDLRKGYSGAPAGGDNVGIRANRGSSAAVQLRWNETNGYWEFTNNSTNYQPVLFPKERTGCKPTYATVTTLTIPTGSWVDSTNKHLITVSSPLTLDITSTGANKLDTGTKANSTWYYVYLIMKSSDGTVAGLISVTNESVSGSVTLPSGYDLKRQLPFTLRVDGSGNFLPWDVEAGWPYQPEIIYNLASTDFSGPTAGTANVLAGGTQTVFTAVSCASFVPPASQMAIINMRGLYISTAQSMYVRQTGSSINGMELRTNAAYIYPQAIYKQKLNSSQQLDYKISGANSSLYVDVMGYVVDQIP